MSEIRWEEETEVREVIADVRDTDCELNWWVLETDHRFFNLVEILLC